MGFLRNRREQLADYLREQIRLGQLREPLPNTRNWAARLGVSCSTLYASLHTLEQERLISIIPRIGITLTRSPRLRSHASGFKTVRIVYRGGDYPESVFADWYAPLAERLQTHDIHFLIERCTDARLAQLAKPVADNCRGRELIFLRSVSDKYQRLFACEGRPSLIIGYRAPGVTLPSIGTDLEGAIRHAVQSLLRQGVSQIALLVSRVPIYGVQVQCHAFEKACENWPHQPVRSEIVRLPLEASAQLRSLHRFSKRIKGRRGVIVMEPVSISGLMTTLHAQGVEIPGMARVFALDTTSASPLVWPPLTRYSFSVEAYVKALTRAAVHFFAEGRLRAFRKTIPLEVVKPDGALDSSTLSP